MYNIRSMYFIFLHGAPHSRINKEIIKLMSKYSNLEVSSVIKIYIYSLIITIYILN